MDFLLVEINPRMISGYILNPTSNRLELTYSKRLKSNKIIKKLYSNNELFVYASEIDILISKIIEDKSNVSVRLYGLNLVPSLLFHNLQDVLKSRYEIEVDIVRLTLTKQKTIISSFLNDDELLIYFRNQIFSLTYKGQTMSHRNYSYETSSSVLFNEIMYVLPAEIKKIIYMTEIDIHKDQYSMIEYFQKSYPMAQIQKSGVMFADMYWSYIDKIHNQSNKLVNL